MLKDSLLQEKPAPVKKGVAVKAQKQVLQLDSMAQKLIAINNQEIKYWEDELKVITSNRSNEVVELVSITSKGNQTEFKFKYLGKEIDSKPVMTLFSSSNMIKPIVEEVPFNPMNKDSKVFVKTLVLPAKSTYYFKLMAEEVIYMGKLVK